VSTFPVRAITEPDRGLHDILRTMERDTSPAAAARYFDLLRARAPHERLAIAVSLSDSVRELAMAGLRMRHPGANEAELRARYTALVYGRDVAIRLFGAACPDDAR
jgi:hypothetical protein